MKLRARMSYACMHARAHARKTQTPTLTLARMHARLPMGEKLFSKLIGERFIKKGWQRTKSGREAGWVWH